MVIRYASGNYEGYDGRRIELINNYNKTVEELKEKYSLD
jgi:hypothetical protein